MAAYIHVQLCTMLILRDYSRSFGLFSRIKRQLFAAGQRFLLIHHELVCKLYVYTFSGALDPFMQSG
jgi:hypothetical protein